MLLSKTSKQALGVAKANKRRGQALVEMALVVTILLFLSMGLIQFALIANARTTLTNLSRDGARYAAIHAASMTDTQLKAYVVTSADSTPLSSITATDITISTPQGRSYGYPIYVSISYNLRSKFILPSTFPGLSRIGTVTSTGVMVIEG